MSYWSYKSYIAALILLLLPSAAWALEVAFPSVQGVEVTDSMGPAEWVRYLFLMAQALVGLAIIYALVRSGVEWMTARGNEGQVKTAKDRITGAVLGLIILLGSYIFLNTINPQLVQIRNPSVPVPENSGLDFYRKLFGQITGDGSLNGSCGDGYGNCITGLTCDLGTKKCVPDASQASLDACGKNALGSGCKFFQSCVNESTGELIGDYNVETGVCTFGTPLGEECTFSYFCYKGSCSDGDGDGVNRCEL